MLISLIEFAMDDVNTTVLNMLKSMFADFPEEDLTRCISSSKKKTDHINEEILLELCLDQLLQGNTFQTRSAQAKDKAQKYE